MRANAIKTNINYKKRLNKYRKHWGFSKDKNGLIYDVTWYKTKYWYHLDSIPVSFHFQGREFALVDIHCGGVEFKAIDWITNVWIKIDYSIDFEHVNSEAGDVHVDFKKPRSAYYEFYKGDLQRSYHSKIDVEQLKPVIAKTDRTFPLLFMIKLKNKL